MPACFPRCELLYPSDAKLASFRPALQRDGGSYLQFLPQSAEARAARRDVDRVRQMSVAVNQNLHRQYHLLSR